MRKGDPQTTAVSDPDEMHAALTIIQHEQRKQNTGVRVSCFCEYEKCIAWQRGWRRHGTLADDLLLVGGRLGRYGLRYDWIHGEGMKCSRPPTHRRLDEMASLPLHDEGK